MVHEIKKIIEENSYWIETSTTHPSNLRLTEADKQEIETKIHDKLSNISESEIEKFISETKEWLQEDEVSPEQVLTYIADGVNPHWDDLNIDVNVE